MNILYKMLIEKVGYYEVHPIFGHLGCMESMVQPTQSLKRLGIFTLENSLKMLVGNIGSQSYVELFI